MKRLNPLEEDGVLPIEKQKIKGKFKHVILTIPALDERWVSSRSIGFYIFPPTKLKNGKYTSGAKEEWLGMMSFVLDDIWWLCELPYHKFWCQVLFDKEAMNGVRSFLHLAPLQKLYFRIEDGEILTMYKRIKKAVFQFLKRLTRTKESTLHFMGEEKYEEIMTNNNLISISLIFCICTVYGKTEETEKMIQYVFKYNKSLKLDEAVLRTTQLFSWLKKKLKNGYKDMRKSIEYCECDKLGEIFNAYRKCIVTAIQCSTNAALSVSNFVSVYNEGCDVFSNYDFEYHIVRTYKKLLLPLYEEVNLLFGDSCFEEVRTRLVSMLNITRGEFLKTFYVCLQRALEKLSNNRESSDVIHNYVKIMKFSTKVEEFTYDFNDAYSIEEITKTINKCNSNFDLTEVDRIKEIMTETYEKMKNNCNLSGDPLRLNGTVNGNNENLETDVSKLKLDDPKEMNDFVENYCIDFEIASQDDRSSECESVDSNNSKELSDDDASSEYSDWTKNDNSDSEYDCYLTNDNSESTEVSASRRQSRDSVDRMSTDGLSGKSDFSEYLNDQPGPSGINTRNLTTKARCRPELEAAITQVKDVLPHLGDGFIVMCLEHYKLDSSAVINAILENNLMPSLKSVDQNLSFNALESSKVSGYGTQNSSTQNYENLKQLKKTEYSSYTEMLNDKSEIEKFKEIYEKYQIVSHNLYDDDVDEDYEEDVIAAIEADPEGLYDNLNKLNDRFVQEEYDYEESNDSQRPPRNPLDFCENPEDIRARAEQRRRTRDEKRNRNSHQNLNPSGAANESDRTTRERHFKNVHKSKSANHSRRYLSDRKRKF